MCVCEGVKVMSDGQVSVVMGGGMCNGGWVVIVMVGVGGVTEWSGVKIK